MDRSTSSEANARERRLAPLVLAAVLTIGAILAASTAHAISPTFVADAKLNLCPEYQLGGVAIEVKFRVGTDQTYQPATVVSENILDSRSGIFRVELPSGYGTVPLNVAAFCRNGFGLSKPSNEVPITNCQALSLIDQDSDGIPNDMEDLDCSNYFSPADRSNPENVDTDGDGVRDLVELLSGTDAINPGSSPRPYVFASAPFDPDADGTAQPVVFRPSSATWFIRDRNGIGNHLSFPFGTTTDVPITYTPRNGTSDVGVVRTIGRNLTWLLHGDGFLRTTNARETAIPFGIYGDNLVPGPWETAGVTNPAVARLFNGYWTFFFYLADGSIRTQVWGVNGDIPKPDDYDGDGIFDVAVYRPSTFTTYAIASSDGHAIIHTFGGPTVDHTVRGDYTGDGKSDISFWEPLSALFTSLTSDNGFDDALGAAQDPGHFQQLQLGTYFVTLPLNWQLINGKLHYTVIDHATGIRTYLPDNSSGSTPVSIQWGLPGDAQG